VSEVEESEAEPELAVTKRNLKLCNWQNNPRDIFIENESELSINLDKNTTIALVGHFDFRISRGAININGANIGAVTRDGQKAKTYRAYVPATQPIFKIRGLDGKNHVQFTSCEEPTPFAKLNPLYEDIWNTGSRGERRRTFGIVSTAPAYFCAIPLLNRPLTLFVDHKFGRRPPRTASAATRKPRGLASCD